MDDNEFNSDSLKNMKKEDRDFLSNFLSRKNDLTKKVD